MILFKIVSTRRRGNVEGDVTKVFWNGVLDLENSQQYTWVGEEHCCCVFKSGARSSTPQTVGVSHLSVSITDVEHRGRASLWMEQ